ncbi:polyribonucleotide nucleotidyltransferase [Candidatus Daviesbacteria bacterium RIFCSPHIGHO2_12_FULL_43_11]|uniref:Polyribonucleotide nucleotidyltransferase n=2 Tax=Candidatus Daviesiibacteriota TaxID=1752718 RepID=A0A1F5K5Q1_9BACT|nr:MAG: polyribonucleotide nucleotidyltransferase [Candidatus Daviesbacteria bacterium RIFCSPHIGHO2_12_FULL_43_11]
MSKIVTREIDLDGRKLKLETGRLAMQADASVVATWGETVVLCTVATQPLKTDLGYFPLSVEYVEKYYAGGRITGQRFIKRETRPPEEAILAGRAIDRAIRPLFPKEFTNEVQVIVTVLSFDGINDPRVLGFIGTSAALSISSVPWAGPLGVTRVGGKEDKFIINPTLEEIEHLDMDLLIASTRDKVAMIETEAKEVKDEVVFEGIKEGHKQAQRIVELIEDLTKEAGKEKLAISPLAEEIEKAVMEGVKTEAKKRIEAALFDTDHPWHEATANFIKAELSVQYAETLTPQIVSGVFDKVAKEIMHETVLEKGKRVDGRAMDEVRPINIELDILPRTHGSAVFERGSTQVLAIATLGPLSVSQTLEGMTGESTKRFMHHYNMGINPFSVGEVKRIGAPSRRDIGHGALVEKSLVNVLPSEEDFPYAMRVVSEVLAANASTSMASLCASTLALLDAGVQLKNPVAGIALGLLSEGDKFQVITDMQAVEDFYGEMDFKVTGTVEGVTAIQMDTKLIGLSFKIIEEALKQGKKAREFIIAKMNEVQPKAGELSKYAPKIETIHIKPEEIGLLIGTGGKNINGIIARTGAQIDVEDDGTVMISSADEEAIKKAVEAISGMFRTFEVGEVFEGKVVRIAPFGDFVELTPGKDGLVHVSQMAPHRVEKPEDVVSEGQTVKVRVTEVDRQGKIGLSMLFGTDIKPESEGSPRFRSGEAGRPREGGSRFGGGERRDFGRGNKPFDHRGPFDKKDRY